MILWSRSPTVGKCQLLCTFGSRVTSKLQSKTNTVAQKGWTSCKCDMRREGRCDAAGEVSDTDEVQFALSPLFLHQIKWRTTSHACELLDHFTPLTCLLYLHISEVPHKQHFLAYEGTQD